MTPIPVVILAGGQGTRLREETEYRPKPMVDIGGRPIIWHIMKLYAHYGFNRFILCLGYRGNMIKEYFLNYEAMNNDFTIQLGVQSCVSYHSSHNEQDFTVTLADTGQDTMTGSRIKRIQRYIDTDTFMVTYGDGVGNINIQALLKAHHDHQRLATVTAVKPISRFGMLDLDKDNQVTKFAEKPQVNSRTSAGFFVFNRGVFDYLSDDPSCTLENEPLEKLTRDEQLVAYPHDGFFYAMDTYRDYLVLNELWKNGNAPWAIWQHNKETL
jgi:glucose-1-phosphate cytidylyltransferase